MNKRDAGLLPVMVPDPEAAASGLARAQQMDTPQHTAVHQREEAS